MIDSQEAPEWNPLTSHLLVDPEDERGICHDFLSEAVLRFEEDDTIKIALVGAIEDLSRQLAKMTMNDNYKPYVLVSTCILLEISIKQLNYSKGTPKHCAISSPNWSPCRVSYVPSITYPG